MKPQPFKKVMLIDDSPLDLHIIRLTLKRMNFAEEIIEKTSAMAALWDLDKLSSTPELIPDVIFLDIIMPVMNGFDFLESFSSFPDSVKNKCSIYMLTASQDNMDQVRARQNKYVKGFLQKPMLNEGMLGEILLSQTVMDKKVV